MVNVADNHSGQMFRSGGREYMEHRKQQLRKSPQYQALLDKRKDSLKARIKAAK